MGIRVCFITEPIRNFTWICAFHVKKEEGYSRLRMQSACVFDPRRRLDRPPVFEKKCVGKEP
jgi:hypothetical protein